MHINKRLQKHFKLIPVVKNKTKWLTINLISYQYKFRSIENVDTDQIIPARFLKQQSVLVLATTFSATGDTTMTTPSDFV
jgi:3-isopropylmalate dehydratase small subunit